MRILAALAVATFAGVMLFVPRIGQPQEYHDFADPRRLDAWTSLPFIAIGIAGLAMVRRATFTGELERRAAIAFYIGTIVTGIGSTIYHLRPDDSTIVYDRLGIVIAFMAFLAMLIHERNINAGWMLPVLLAIGVASVLWWVVRDDLRPYGFVQFFPIIAIVALLILEKPRYSGEVSALAAMAVLYGLAKVFEFNDRKIYDTLAISGHTLKHLAAIGATMTATIWIVKRRITSS